MSHRLVLSLAAVLLAPACSPAPEPSTPQPPTPSSTPAPTVSSATLPAPAASSPASPAPSSAAPSASPFASWTGEPARDTVPPGVTPLDDQEASEADKKCKPMQDALAAEARKLKGKSATDAVLEVLANPPKVKGVDVPRCAALIRRDLIAYRATTLESEAIQTLTIIARSVQNALQREPRTLCPSAPPVPADFARLQPLPYRSAPEDWAHDGWKCLKINVATPQYFQFRYELDEPTQTFAVVARGYPVAGQPPVELFLRGKVVDRDVRASEVLRRK